MIGKIIELFHNTVFNFLDAPVRIKTHLDQEHYAGDT